jgi:hypothetical protein
MARNYPLSASYALSLLGDLQDLARYRERGRLLSRQAMGFFSKADGFVFGEGTPYYQASPKGCFSVDLGYNVEETLPSLTLCGLLNKDEELLAAVVWGTALLFSWRATECASYVLSYQGAGDGAGPWVAGRSGWRGCVATRIGLWVSVLSGYPDLACFGGWFSGDCHGI